MLSMTTSSTGANLPRFFDCAILIFGLGATGEMGTASSSEANL